MPDVWLPGEGDAGTPSETDAGILEPDPPDAAGERDAGDVPDGLAVPDAGGEGPDDMSGMDAEVLDAEVADAMAPDMTVDGAMADAALVDGAIPDMALLDMAPPDMAPPPTPCDADEACLGGFSCALNAELDTVCGLPPGPGRPGGPCEVDGDCRSGLCEDGACQRFCADSSGCLVGEGCRAVSVERDGAQGEVQICQRFPDTPCTTEADCPEPERVCSDLREEGLFCGVGFPEGAAAGTACEGALQGNPQCASGICLSGISNVCSGACGADADCDGVTLCGEVRFEEMLLVRLCLPTCARAADCTDGQVCTVVENRAEDRRDLICRTAIGDGAVGAQCDDGGDCESGLCLTQGDTRYCTTPCTGAADCPAQAALCAAASAPRPISGEPEEVLLCHR